MTYDEIIERINLECKKRDISVYKLSGMSSVPISTLYGVLHRNSRAQVDTLCEILAALDLSLTIEPLQKKAGQNRKAAFMAEVTDFSDEKKEVMLKLAEWLRDE